MPDQTDVQSLLARLEAERAELDVTIAHLRRLAGLPPTNGESTSAMGGTSVTASVGRDAVVTGRVRSDEFFRLSVREAIIKYLSIMKQPQNPAAIVAGLKAGGVLTTAKNFYANVNTELKRMRARDLVVNTTAGWGLSEWYPQKPKQPESPKPKKKSKGRGKAKARGGKQAHVTGSGNGANAPAARGKSWPAFFAEKKHAGMSMAEAAAEWKKLKEAEV